MQIPSIKCLQYRHLQSSGFSWPLYLSPLPQQFSEAADGRWRCQCWSTQTISLMKSHVPSDSLNSDCVCQYELDKPVVQGYSQGIISEHSLYKAVRLILWQVEQAVPSSESNTLSFLRAA